MKNTKNLLITGIALATVLFASVQVTAAERPWNTPYSQINPENDRNETMRVNPHLSEQDKQHFWNQINYYATLKRQTNDPRNPAFIAEARKRFHSNARLQSNIDKYKSMYYGNKAYSEDEQRDIINQ